MMPPKKKLYILVAQVVLLAMLSFLFSQWEAFMVFYSRSVYPILQSYRCVFLNIFPFSVGDLLYLLAGLWLLLTVVRWLYYIRKFGVHKDRLMGSVLNTLNVLVGAYIFFLIFWGGNYYKEPLAKSWRLDIGKKLDKEVRRKRNQANLVAFNKFLANKLNNGAHEYISLPHEFINQRAVAYYWAFTDCRVKDNGLNIKSSLYSSLMLRMGIDGYYNPFTGEGQANMRQPQYIMPFVVCHEMAHQAGIAAEGDANLLAYALCTTVDDPIFQYSAYLNLWLYANNRLYRLDSLLAREIEETLPALTKRQIDTLEQLYKQYHGTISHTTSEIYDSYLRLQQQEGISSYGNVVREAWAWEQQRGKGKKKRHCLFLSHAVFV